MSITLYNQYIYKNGVWYLVGVSDDSGGGVTYELSGSGATITLTGSDESTSSATVSGFLTTESDPTVPSWAKASSKPTYTASEVGALPSTTVIPSKTSDLQNDSGFITGYTETDPTVPSWAKASSKPSYTASEVGAATSSHTHGSITNDGKISSDTTVASGDKIVITDSSASSAIKRSSIAFGTATTTFLRNDGSWQTPAYPVTSVNTKTGAVSLTASDVGALPSSTSIPTKVSDLTNDAGYITGYTETDPTVPSWAKASSKPSYTASEVGAIANPSSKSSGQFLKYNGSAWVADNVPAAPVSSVNSYTGAVVLTASDVGALPDDTPIPSVEAMSTTDIDTAIAASQ